MRIIGVNKQLRGGFQTFISHIIELHRGDGIASGEPFVEVHLAAALAAKRFARSGGGFAADGTGRHYAATAMGTNP